MALLPLGFYLRVTLVDNGGNASTLSYKLRAPDHTGAVTATAAMLPFIAAASNSVISRYTISQAFEEAAFAYPGAGVENEDKASITVLLDATGAKKANIKIPAPKIAMFQNTIGPGANIVDVTSQIVTDYVSMFTSAGQAYISDGEDAASAISGKRVSAKNNNG